MPFYCIIFLHDHARANRLSSGLHINIERSDAALIELYPPTATTLSSLPRRKRVEVLSAILLLLLSRGHYTSYSRILLLHIVSSFHLPLHVLTEDEIKVAQGLAAAAKQMSGDEEARKRSESSQLSRKWKVGLAGVAGAALIGVTGGLAAPLVAGAIGGIMGGIGLGGTAAAGLLTTLSSSGVVVGGLFGAYGYGMTSKMMDEYAKEVEDFAFLPMRGSRRVERGIGDVSIEGRRLRVTVGISGWLTQEKDVITPWSVLGKGNEVFALRWEVESLMEMGKAIESVVSSAAWTAVSTEIISHTVFASLMFALWPIALLKVSKIVDNPFAIAKNRADKAGLILADAIINKAQGDRPITLIGYSMGARLIYSCLMSLAERRAFGFVEAAVLIGTPAPSDASVWRSIRSVVAGRLVNVYSDKDRILAFLYRTSSIQLGVAGLEEIEGVVGVESVDVGNIVNGHLRYQHSVGIILEKIGWEDIDVQEVGKEELVIKMLDNEEQRKRERSSSHSESKRAGDQPTIPKSSGKAHPLGDSDGKDSVAIRERPSTRVLPKPVSKPIAEEEDLISFDDYEIQELEAKQKEPERIVEPKKERGGPIPDYLHAGKSDKRETRIALRDEEHGIVMHDMDEDDMAMREYDEPIAMIDEEDDGTEMHRYNEPIPVPDHEPEEMEGSGPRGRVGQKSDV
jgi:Protein of unknown function (DUF726)